MECFTIYQTTAAKNGAACRITSQVMKLKMRCFAVSKCFIVMV